MTWQIGALVVGVAGSVAAPRRIRAWTVASGVALVALLTGIIGWGTFGDTVAALAAPLAFLVVAVPLAVLLDEVGFFGALAAMIDDARHLRLALWAGAAMVTVVFNLDAAVVLLTPLYVRIAVRHHDDPLALAFIPALIASLASSVLPVSNLTNLVLAHEFDLGVRDFLVHAAPVAIAATAVGWLAYRRIAPPEPPHPPAPEVVDRRALRVGVPVVAFLLVGFTLGDAAGIPAWVVAALALGALGLHERRIPWRAVPLPAVVLALGLGTLALGAADALPVERVLSVGGPPGDALAFAVTALAANAANNLPAVLVAVPALHANEERVWSVLLGANIGPTLWVTGALSTLLWQATMRRLARPVSPRRYAATGVRLGVPALAAALVVHLVVQSVV